jgi:hypothetical protein
MTHENKTRGEIGLADLLTALNELLWENDEQAQAIFHALGFNWKNRPPQTIEQNLQKEVFDRNRYRQKPLKRQEPNPDQASFSAPPSPMAPIELPKEILSSNLKPLPKLIPDSTPPAWLNDNNEFLTSVASPPKPARKNLFPAMTNRGILSAALNVKKQGKEVNIPVLIKQVIKGRIPKNIPRLDCITLERGCQLLLDYSDSMVPFWEDLSALANQVEDLLGKERVKIYEFDQDPAAGKHWTLPANAKNWQAEVGRPIMVASNLGITGQQRQWPINSTWRAFIDQCKKNNIPLLILVPWQESYWPTDIGNHPVLIHWNPHTTATMIHKLVGKGHEVCR